MREVEHVDIEGRKWRVLVNDDDPDSMAQYGIPFCPTDLSDLGLPLDFEIRLHNQLFERRIVGHADAAARATDITAAIRTALRVDAQMIIEAFRAD